MSSLSTSSQPIPIDQTVTAVAILTFASSTGRVLATSSTGTLNNWGGYPMIAKVWKLLASCFVARFVEGLVEMICIFYEIVILHRGLLKG